MAGQLQHQLKRWPGWILLVLVVVGFLAVGSSRSAGPRTPDERLEDISSRLACPICAGESVFESRNVDSDNIRTEIKAQIDQGTSSDTQIITFIADRYGARVLLVPNASGLDALVWALPVAALLCAVVGLAFAFRRWRLAIDTVPDDADRALVASALVDSALVDSALVDSAPADSGGPPPAGDEGDGR
ncbi:MAG: cytochrome c-type biogenesis protein CcmH [Ilumatobacteraceae bacterium]